MFLGGKLKNRRQIPSKTFFFRDHQIFATEIKFCSPKWVVKLPWVGKWTTAWKRLKNAALEILTRFVTTYLCEHLFSILVELKTKNETDLHVNMS